VGPHWEHVLEELARLGKLTGDWDGQGALPPAPANLERALAWVKEMSRWPDALLPTHIFPGTTGEVVLEWRGESFHLIAEIGEPGRIEWLLRQPGQPARQWDTDAGFGCFVRAER
jgi:hypothetical protein